MVIGTASADPKTRRHAQRTAVPAARSGKSAARARKDVVKEALHLRDAQLQDLTTRKGHAGSLRSEVAVNGQRWTLVLEPFSVRSPDFKVLKTAEAGG
ncbi:MAG: hypothetical protein PVI86_19225, partial [Phycisphaerae bacterium]